MTNLKRRPDAETQYSEHLQRSKTMWDRWSGKYRKSEQDFEPIRADLIAQLDLEEGDRVLDIGCGPGVNFGLIRDEIGEDGHLVAFDYSPEMVTKAKKRIAANGWENVEVKRADATTAELGDDYDVAIATLSLSVMPDVEQAVKNIHSALNPRAQLGVLDLQLFESGMRRVVNPLLQRFFCWYANWNAEDDVRMAVDTVFEESELIDTHLLGAAYTLKAERSR